jgi:hypothetical protein
MGCVGVTLQIGTDVRACGRIALACIREAQNARDTGIQAIAAYGRYGSVGNLATNVRNGYVYEMNFGR